MQRSALLLAALLAAAPLHAQTLRLAGILGGKALMVSGSNAPRAVAPGESIDGVRVVSVSRESVVIESVGGRETLHLGAEPVSVGTHGSAPQQLTLYADARGHFVSGGQINGRPVQYMVDTGATAVSLGRAEAERLGIRVQQGQPVRMQTANGVAEGWRVRLDSVRIGALEQRGVEAIITSEPMPYVLLGNSFLKPYEMTRKGNELLLQKR